MAYNSRMKICQQPANQIGGQTVWGVRIENWKSPNLDLGWWSLSNTETIDVALTQAGIPLVGWYTGRGAEQQHQFEVMQRAKII